MVASQTHLWVCIEHGQSNCQHSRDSSSTHPKPGSAACTLRERCIKFPPNSHEAMQSLHAWRLQKISQSDGYKSRNEGNEKERFFPVHRKVNHMISMNRLSACLAGKKYIRWVGLIIVIKPNFPLRVPWPHYRTTVQTAQMQNTS